MGARLRARHAHPDSHLARQRPSVLTGAVVNRASPRPALLSTAHHQDEFGPAAQVSSALLRVAPGTDEPALLSTLQANFISSSLVATSIRQVVERSFAATRGFFQLMLGFLALGLVVCLTGLGVVMVRAVREGRRTIGVLRAPGFRTGTVHRSFMLESSFIALEGILLGWGYPS